MPAAFAQAFGNFKKILPSVHTLVVAPALASSELIKELQLLYSVLIVHVRKPAEQARNNAFTPSKGLRTHLTRLRYLCKYICNKFRFRLGECFANFPFVLRLPLQACCSPETGIAFASRQQNSGVAKPGRFQRIRAAPLGWASPVVTVALEELSVSDEANVVEFHADGASGRRGIFRLVLDAARASAGRSKEAYQMKHLVGLPHAMRSLRKGHIVTEWVAL